MPRGGCFSQTSPEKARIVQTETRALQLRLAGQTLEAIAEACGYADRSGAHKAIKRALKRIPAPVVEEYRTVQDLRCDALLAAVWADATDPTSEGRNWAIDRAIAIERFRAELQGTSKPAKDKQLGTDGGPVEFILVIPGKVTDARSDPD